ncbi:MAG: HEAT repeat domain-containing protein [Pyrinomonadaceae bacterium]
MSIDEGSVVHEQVGAPSENVSVVAEVSKVSVSRESFLLDLRSADPNKRIAALAGLAPQGNVEDFGLIAGCFDDPSPQVRHAAARALRDLEPDRTVESFTRAIEEGSPARARNIGIAIADSGLASEALQDLSAQSREDTYKALSLLFVMAKSGHSRPLIQAIEEHPELEVSSAAVKLLNLNGQSDAAEAALQRRRERGG